MSAREYRDACHEVTRITRIIETMKDELPGQIRELEQDIVDAKVELKEDKIKALSLGNKLEVPFAVKVDNDLVYRVAKNQPIQIILITEE